MTQSLISELESAIQSGSKDKRLDTLRRITDLFLVDADRLNEQQISVFDDVLASLIKRVEAKAIAELSQRLAPVRNAPTEVVRRLARHDDIAVAEPILAKSTRLSDADLIEIARTKSQAHLLAISGRDQLKAALTDTLLDRGDREVTRRLAANSGAHFSENGFATLVKRSEQDDELAQRVGLRLDVPIHLFRELLLRATEAVRSRLLAAAGPESREQIQRALADASEEIGFEADIQSGCGYADAKAGLLELQRTGGLTEAVLFDFARKNKHVEVITALSILTGAPVEIVVKLLQSKHCEALFVLCKSAGLEWPSVRMIAGCRAIGGAISEDELNAARADYATLTISNAQRVLRFWQVRQATSSNHNEQAPASRTA